MADSVKIPLGKGTIELRGDPSRFLRGHFYIRIFYSSRPGPCKDELCTMVTSFHAMASDFVPEDYRIIAGNGFYIIIDPAIYDSIDKNRQNVTLRIGFSGKASIKGLYL